MAKRSVRPGHFIQMVGMLRLWMKLFEKWKIFSRLLSCLEFWTVDTMFARCIDMRMLHPGRMRPPPPPLPPRHMPSAGAPPPIHYPSQDPALMGAAHNKTDAWVSKMRLLHVRTSNCEPRLLRLSCFVADAEREFGLCVILPRLQDHNFMERPVTYVLIRHLHLCCGFSIWSRFWRVHQFEFVVSNPNWFCEDGVFICWHM